MKRLVSSFIAILLISTLSSRLEARPLRMIDLKVSNISLTPDCRVKIEIENVGNRKVPPFFWNQNVLNPRITPKVTIRKNNHLAKRVKLIDIPNSRNLIFPNGKVVYTTDIIVRNRAVIKAVVDSNNILLESNEANNKKIRVLRCDRCSIERKPDLVIRDFKIDRWGVCEPNRVVIYFKVKVENIGDRPTPFIPDKALVQVMDKDGSNWGNGEIIPRIYPGQVKTVIIPVYYLKSNPEHLRSSNLTHRFRAIVDPLHLVDEENERNNKSHILRVRTSHICQ